VPPTLVDNVEHREVTPAERLERGQLYRSCDPAILGFRTTDDLSDSPITLGQNRAVSAIQFGIGIRHDGYNLFARGPTGGGKHAVVRQYLEQQAASEATARDWCYVYNFEHPHGPRAISLPAGRGNQIDTVDQGMQLLTGVPAGSREVNGQFPAGTVNDLVERRLIALARQARAFKVSVEERLHD
jgi:hypothetical protein